MRRKTTARIFQETNWRNLIRENLDIAMKGKSQTEAEFFLIRVV